MPVHFLAEMCDTFDPRYTPILLDKHSTDRSDFQMEKKVYLHLVIGFSEWRGMFSFKEK
jgi:hypothetical protein